LLSFLRESIDNVKDVFSGILFISRYILHDPIFLGSAKAYSRWGGKLSSHLMASCVRNIWNKNYQNLLTVFQVTIENVGYVFCT